MSSPDDAAGTPAIDRVRPADRTVLVTDRGPVPMNIAALLELDATSDLSPDDLIDLLTQRIPRVPRLRQRLCAVAPGFGAPVWVDDADFEPDRHLATIARPAPGDRRALLDLAADLACRPLPRDRPLWRGHLVLEPDAGSTTARVAAVILVMHHVLADGLGGLAVLGALADGPFPAVAGRSFPLPPPSGPQLLADAMRRRIGFLGRLPAVLRRGVTGLRELGWVGGERPQAADRIWLNVPTGPRRRVAVAEAPLVDVVRIAHAAGGTVNDVVLAAVTGAMLAMARARGEEPRRLIVSVPVSGRRSASANDLGNDTGVRPVAVPAIADDSSRLAAVVAATQAVRAVPRAASSGPLGAAFRTLARVGLFRVFIEHQRLIHTFETNLRGPSALLRLGGVTIVRIVPITQTPGNVTVNFATLSYAGGLGVTVVADPDAVGDPTPVAHEVSASIGRLRATVGDTPPPAGRTAVTPSRAPAG